MPKKSSKKLRGEKRGENQAPASMIKKKRTSELTNAHVSTKGTRRSRYPQTGEPDDMPRRLRCNEQRGGTRCLAAMGVQY